MIIETNLFIARASHLTADDPSKPVEIVHEDVEALFAVGSIRREHHVKSLPKDFARRRRFNYKSSNDKQKRKGDLANRTSAGENGHSALIPFVVKDFDFQTQSL